jgi:HK97 family phage prohead protease
MKEFRGCSYEIKGLDEKGIVTFIANAYGNKDTDGDISLPGSFAKTISENAKRIRHFKYHNSTLMPGVIVDLKETDEGLQATSQLILGTQLGRETYEEYKAMFSAGKQMEHSVGVNAIKYERDEEQDCRKVMEWKLWEVSTLTAWGANDKAVALSIKDLSGATREEIEREIIFLKGLLNISSYSDLKLEQIEKQYNFLDKLKAGMQPEDASLTTDITTLNEFKELLGFK